MKSYLLAIAAAPLVATTVATIVVGRAEYGVRDLLQLRTVRTAQPEENECNGTCVGVSLMI